MQNTHYTISSLPQGLALRIQKFAYSISVYITGTANSHTSADNTTIMITLLTAAFESLDASALIGNPIGIPIEFKD